MKGLLVICIALILSLYAMNEFSHSNAGVLSMLASKKEVTSSPTPTPVPEKKTLNNEYHIFQSYNNCGPASLSLALSYFGINKSQEELGEALRPYQNTDGDNDDKSVTFDEMGKKAESFGLLAYHRPNGDIKLLEQFIAAGIPVITRTWLHENEDIGHYRLIRGYDQNEKTILQDDTYQGRGLTYTYDEFNTIWNKYNYEYLVLVPKNKKHLAESILGKNVNEKYAWEQAKANSLKKLSEDPSSMYDRFNLSVAYYHLGDKKKSVEEYEKVEADLPFRTLWYQTEPILAYYELGNYDKVMTISDQILNNQNRAFSELYVLRGKIMQKQGNQEAADEEFANARLYNSNLKF